MSQYIQVGLGAATGLKCPTAGSVPLQTPTGIRCFKCPTGTPTWDAKKAMAVCPSGQKASATDWAGLAKSGLEAITAIFGKGAAPAPVAPEASGPNYLPWILGGAVVLGGVLLLTRKKSK